MPRNGLGVMAKPAGTTAVPNTTVESAKFNSVVDDIIDDLNAARPVTAGGTGQTSTRLPDTWTFADPVDLTKQVRLDAGNVTAGETRVLTAPDEDIVLVGTTATQTLTNKTLTSPVFVDLSGEFLRGYISGLTLSNNVTDATNDVDFATGSAASKAATPILMTLPSATTKRLDANWAAGTGNGMRYSGAAIADTTYGTFFATKAAGADPDIYAYPLTAGTDADSTAFHATVLTALQAETGGADYTHIRRIGSILRVSSTILFFTQRGDEFLLNSPRYDLNSTAISATASLRAFSVPLGLKVDAIISGYHSHSSGHSILITSPDQADESTAADGRNTSVANSNQVGSFQVRVRTNTSAQLRFRANATLAEVRATTMGWVDTRGRFN
jgi:hypothetical protein